MDTVILCLHQWIRPPHAGKHIPISGVGNCNECLPDEENNKKCKSYRPVTIKVAHVQEPKESDE